MENNATNPIEARPHTGGHNLPAGLSRLTDVATDVELVAREFCLREAMLESLRGALDRLNCAQSVLEAGFEGLASGGPGRGDCEGLDDCGLDGERAMKRVRHAVELLAEEWPQDYPEGAVEWLIAGGV